MEGRDKTDEKEMCSELARMDNDLTDLTTVRQDIVEVSGNVFRDVRYDENDVDELKKLE
jgi:hypothetical protein